MLKRKIDGFLRKWKSDPDRNPLIIYGARQIGKTTSIREFGRSYRHFIEINFIENPQYKLIFSSFNVDEIIRKISFANPDFVFEPHNTLILFDEIQECMNATTSLKFFKLDGRYDVICSGSALGVNVNAISSVSVGFKEEYFMYPLDFEEFLYALGYDEQPAEYCLQCMKEKKPLDDLYFNKLNELYTDYVILGGYPKIISNYISNNRNFSRILKLQRLLYNDYVDDISKYLTGIDLVRAQRMFRSVTSQLAKDNHKFQFTKLQHGARFSEYYGVSERLKNAGVVLTANNCRLSLPLNGNEEENNFRMYYSDTSLLIASLDDDAQKDLRINQNMAIYNGAIYESVMAMELTRQGYDLHFYRNEDSTIELDFIIRHKNEILPLEVKAKQGKMKSLKKIIGEQNSIRRGIKFANANIGYSDNIMTLPRFTTFLLKRFLESDPFDQPSSSQ